MLPAANILKPQPDLYVPIHRYWVGFNSLRDLNLYQHNQGFHLDCVLQKPCPLEVEAY
jgi:hypothetical protein